MAQLGEDEEDVRKSEGGGEEWKQEDDGKDLTGGNPLEKYMKMVLEARGEQQEKVPCTLGHHSVDFFLG